jgi:glycosyltransferase involved in cell wall biosynthesis
MLVTVYDLFHLAMPEFASGYHKQLYAKLMFQAVKRRASAILTISDFTKNEFIRLTGPSVQPIYPIHLGVSKDWFGIPRQESSHQSPYILFVGNVKPHKNLRLLVKAFKLISNKIPHNLIIVGKKDGFISGDEQVKKDSLELGQRIIFSGYIDDQNLKQYVANAAALVFPSLYEGFGLPPIEAMAAGCPVILSDIASLREICGDAGLYFDPRDVNQLSDRILQVIYNPDLQNSLRAKGLIRAQSFSWEECIDKTCEVIDRVLS